MLAVLLGGLSMVSPFSIDTFFPAFHAMQRALDVEPWQLQQVLTCLLQGDAEKRVAERLGISCHTVNRHVQRLYRRFNVHSRGELMFVCRDMRPLAGGKAGV